MFFDVVLDDSTARLETRVYHEESGNEVVFPGVEPDVWTGWILERIQATGQDVDWKASKLPATVELEASIAIVGIAPARSLTVRVSAQGGVDAPDDLERELGAAFVRAVTQLLDMGKA